MISIARWVGTATGLAAIVAFYRLLFHANQTTVALTLLLLILFVAATWGLRLAVVCSFVAAGCYNFFFLPPIGSFTVADPQNLVAIFVFLITSVVASRLSERMRAESKHARSRQAELEVLYRLSRGLLQTDELSQMTNAIATAILSATGCQSVLFYLLEGDRLYHAGLDWSSQTSLAEFQELSQSPGALSPAAGEAIIPLRTGVKPQGALILRGVYLALQTLEAIGGLVSVSLDRARAMEAVTHEELVKEGERLRSSVLDSITQDLWTPLTAIKGAVDTLLTLDVDAPTARELLLLMDEESSRLNQILAETIELARLETQQTSMELAPESVSHLIQGALDARADQLKDRQVSVRISADLPEVWVDTLRIQKVLGHLLENAATYSGPSDPIFLSAERSGGSVACSIADRGTGIASEEQALIFDRLYRVRERKVRPSGESISLAICRAIVEAHHGSLSVTSQLGRGSVFTVCLPSVPDH